MVGQGACKVPIQYLLEFPKFCNTIPTMDTVEIAK